MRTARKDLRPLLRRLEQAGATVVQGSKHPKVFWQGRFVCTLPVTVSCSRSLKNTEAQLRRAGIPI